MSDLERYTPEFIWRMGLDKEGEWVNGDASDKRIRELEEENERLRKDAERYRWLRKQHWNYSNLVVVTEPRKNVKLGSDMPFEDRLDAAIDAARERGDEQS